MIQGIVPGPQLISQHPDIFWGLVASFWIGNMLLVLLNVPLIGLWVKMLAIPYRFLYPSALFFVCIGVYAANNDFFQVGEVVVMARSDTCCCASATTRTDPARFRARPALRGDFRRAMLIARGDITVFVTRPISAVFIGLCVLLITTQLFVRLRGPKGGSAASPGRTDTSPPISPEMAPQRIPVTPAE